VATAEQLNEALPDLPVCKVLKLMDGAVGAVTLRVLSGMHMPALEELRLQRLVVGDDDEDDGEAAAAALELAWLAQLPALRKVVVGYHPGDGFDAVRQTMHGLLASKPWVQVFRWECP
jgi:hypothetical protein